MGKVTLNPAAMASIDERMRQTMVTAAQTYERIWQQLLRGSKSGRIYRVGKTPSRAQAERGATFREHQASAPGEPPAINTGTLSRSIRRTVVREAWGRYRATISWQVVYLRFLEFGTTRMKARPSVRPALRILQTRMREIMGRVRKGGRMF